MQVLALRRSLLPIVALLLLASAVTAHRADAQPQRRWTPDDPLFEQQWGLDQLRIPAAWKWSRGRGTTIAVIGHGVLTTHPDLAANIVPGRTFSSDCPDPVAGCSDGASDTHYHETSVAGVAAAVADNGEGLAGAAPHAKIMPIKTVVESTGRYAEPVEFASAIRWAVDQGVEVINISVGYALSAPELTVIGDAIDYAISEGVVVVQAAGNSAAPLCMTAAGLNDPVQRAGVICVGATDKREARSAYSQGPVTLEERAPAVFAPGGSELPVCGENIPTTWPYGTVRMNPCGYPDGYESGFGTSVAAPFVSGVAALLTSVGCTGGEATALITSTARNPSTGERGQWSATLGYGIVDAEAAMASAVRQCRSRR